MEKKEIEQIIDKIDDIVEDCIEWDESWDGEEESVHKSLCKPRFKNQILDLIIQKLDKAREELLIELQEEFSEFGVPDDVRYTQPVFYINCILEEKLSKLKE